MHSKRVERTYPRGTRGALRPIFSACILALSGLASVGLAPSASSAAPAQSTTPSASEYVAQRVCATPGPGEAGCLSELLEPRTATARKRARWHAAPPAAPTPQTGALKATECSGLYEKDPCYSPAQLQDAYFPGEEPLAPASAPQTIALIDAYNDLHAEEDLSVYTSEFHLQACTKLSGCFRKVGEGGSESEAHLPFPKNEAELEKAREGTTSEQVEAEKAEGWALETSTDIEMARAICNNCKILLVEAESTGYGALETAEQRAVALGATEVSNSWGGPEPSSDSPTFEHRGTVITASTGDDGYLNWEQYATRNQQGSPYFEGASYPASLPHVVAVGGTSLSMSPGGAWEGETAWSSGGSGCSARFEAKPWQQAVGDWSQVGCGTRRANADVAAVANPDTGVDVYDTTPYPTEIEHKPATVVPHWVPIGGTSVASPIIASMFALAGGAKGVEYPAKTLYSHLGEASLHDVTLGGNGDCEGKYTKCSGSMIPLSPLDCGASYLICKAAVGYDGPTGVGTPHGIAALEPLEGESTTKEPSEEHKEEPPAKEEPSTKREPPTPTTPVTPGATTPVTPATSIESSTGTTAKAKAKARPRVSALRLTARARAALRGGAPRAQDLGFSFTLSRAALMHATLEVQTRVGSRLRWHVLSGSLLRFEASAGHDQRHLKGSSRLQAGLYRLLLSATDGNSRSVSFRLG